jgi:3-dehydroquinate dehydratase / shikimate dehydrogenase
VTYLCVPIFVRTAEQGRRDMARAAEAGAEMLELRIDELQDMDVLDGLLRDHRRQRVPIIVTCRPTSEGGMCPLDDEARVARLMQPPAAIHASFVDVELAALQRHPTLLERSNGMTAQVIISSHDFSGRPDRLYNIVDELNRAAAQVTKIAWTARTLRDNLEAFELLQTRPRPTIALCMGETGIISRILAKKFGAFLTFASLDADSATAPGQVSIGDMKSLYRWDKITASTKVYGVVANPVGHSMSPAIHNAAFDATNYDGVYVPLLVNPGYESFKAFMESFIPFQGLDLSGLSVTLPHKENALRYLQEKGAQVEDLAARIGAVNTIVIDGKSLRGINTDYAAILDSITAALKCSRADLAGMSAAVLGAGGTGRTAVAALAHCGAIVVIYNRTPTKAAALADEFGATTEPWENLPDADCRIYINTTSVGMHPNIDASPFGANPPKLGASSVVFDTIYNPMKTRLLQQAESAGAKTISGVEMFVQQAAEQFAAWTKMAAPTQVMRRVIESKLAG